MIRRQRKKRFIKGHAEWCGERERQVSETAQQGSPISIMDAAVVKAFAFTFGGQRRTEVGDDGLLHIRWSVARDTEHLDICHASHPQFRAVEKEKIKSPARLCRAGRANVGWQKAYFAKKSLITDATRWMWASLNSG